MYAEDFENPLKVAKEGLKFMTSPSSTKVFVDNYETVRICFAQHRDKDAAAFEYVRLMNFFLNARMGSLEKNLPNHQLQTLSNAAKGPPRRDTRCQIMAEL
jgi:hypothetical protein